MISGDFYFEVDTAGTGRLNHGAVKDSADRLAQMIETPVGADTDDPVGQIVRAGECFADGVLLREFLPRELFIHHHGIVPEVASWLSIGRPDSESGCPWFQKNRLRHR